MQFLSSKLKKFDVHTKTVDGVTDQTILGAIITIISATIIFFLISSSLNSYFESDTVGHMIADTSVGLEDIKILFDLTFGSIECDSECHKMI